MNVLIKNILPTVLVLVVLLGCRSPQRLIQKALEKDPNIIKCVSDTLTLYKDTSTLEGYDSLTIDNRDVFIQVRGKGKLEISYLVKQQVTSTPVITSKDSNSQTRQKEKTRRREVKEYEKTKRAEIKQSGKTDRKVSDNNRKIVKSNNKAEVKKSRNFSIWVLIYLCGLITIPLINLGRSMYGKK